MILDIAIWSIIVLAMVFGFRRGFVYTFIHTIDWILALVVAFIWTPRLKTYVAENTGIYTWLSEVISNKFSQALENADISYNSLPEIISDPLVSASQELSVSLADSITGFLFSVICFIAIILAVKLVLWLILSVLSKKHTGGFVGFLDGALGLVVGFVKGLLIVWILLAIMLPAVNLLSPENIEAVTEMLEKSYTAKDFYDNNLLLLIIRDFVI